MKYPGKKFSHVIPRRSVGRRIVFDGYFEFFTQSRCIRICKRVNGAFVRLECVFNSGRIHLLSEFFDFVLGNKRVRSTVTYQYVSFKFALIKRHANQVAMKAYGSL